MTDLIFAALLFIVGATFGYHAGQEEGWKEHYRGEAKCETVFVNEVVCKLA